MPGGRLTHQDRRHIALGLAEGLGYAEIARRLGRPTSTVSREVGRNGGPDGYRPDHAHQATRWRARRLGPVLASQPPTGTDVHGRDPEAVRGFVERFAALMVGTGLPRMAARVLTCLVTHDSGALTAAELVQRLRVSPASVSKAVAYLEGLDVIRRERGPRRRERYIIDDGVWLRTWLTSARTNARWAETARGGAEIFNTATPAGARLEHMSHFFARLSEDMAGGSAETAGDVLTVLAALVHASKPLTAGQLATALDWPMNRVTSALHAAEQGSDITDPVTLRHDGTGVYTVTASPGRLTTAQYKALDRC